MAKKLQDIDLDLENLPALRYFICDDYCGKKDTCFLFLLINHAYCDGMSFVGMWNSMSE